MFSPSGGVSLWLKRFLIALTVLAWITIVGISAWALGYISGALILMIISITLAYVIYPAVKFLARFMPNLIAIFLVYSETSIEKT